MEDTLLNKETALSSMKTVLTLIDKRHKKQPLMEEAHRVSAVISLKKMPDLENGQWKNIVVKMPYCPTGERPSVCLFVKDLRKGKRIDDEPTILHYKDFLRERGIDFVDEIIPFHMLRTEFKPFELKRHLAARHDKFLADERIFPYLPKLLGKNFIEKKGIPVKIKLEDRTFNKDKLQSLISSHCFLLKPMSTSYHIPIGNSMMMKSHLVKNLMAVSRILQKRLPGGWTNVRSIMIKSDKTMSIPCYVSSDVGTYSQRSNLKERVNDCNDDDEEM